MKLEACLDEIDWTIICHNFEAFNCPQEEYPPRSLPIPLDYIDNLQSRLVKVKKGILPPTLKMILKTDYYLPARQAPMTSPAVQPDDMIGRHRNGENNPLEQPQVSEEEKNMVADGTSSTDKGGDFVSQTEIGMDHEASQVAARHFELAMFWQHQGTTAGRLQRETCFSRIGTAAEMDAQHFRTNLASEPFYSKLCNPRWP